MKIALLGLQNLPALAPEFAHHTIGGESVQQSLLGQALARRGHDVRMVTLDYGQVDGTRYRDIRLHKAYRADDGLPVLRFVHPRWTGLWSALARADADVYYTSCAGMHVGLLAMFCRRHRRRFVFRCASDSDCDPSTLLVRYARDRWLYAYGLRRAHAILVQSASQAEMLERRYRLRGRPAGMLVAPAAAAATRDIDVLWVSNIRQVKRPDRVFDLAAALPDASVHMAGGPLPGEQRLYREVQARATTAANITFHGPLPYRQASALFARARIMVNLSDVEGFPNTFLQAWIAGVPVVSLFDPDRLIERERLGIAARSPADAVVAARRLLADQQEWLAASRRCRAFMARDYADDRILEPYLAAFEPAPSAAGMSAALANTA